MLNPEQAARLRNLIRSRNDTNIFEGFHVSSTVMNFASDMAYIKELTIELGTVSKMREPARIFGSPIDPVCLRGVDSGDVRSADKRLYEVRKAVIIGNHTVVGPFGVLSPSEVQSAGDVDRFLIKNQANHDGFVAEKRTESELITATYVCPASERAMPGCGIMLHNIEPGNYGSFLFRVIPQMLFVKASMNEIHFDFYITPARTTWFAEAIRLIGLPERPVFTLADLIGFELESLIICSDFDNEGWFDTLTSARLSELSEAARRLRGPYEFGSRLYIARTLGGGHRPNYRRLTNESGVVDLVKGFGFEVIFPETLSLASQIQIFDKASFVCGPSGSGMLNAMFSKENTKVFDLESFHVTVRQHAKIYSSTGKIYAFGFGEFLEPPTGSPSFANWYINPSVVREGLAWLVD